MDAVRKPIGALAAFVCLLTLAGCGANKHWTKPYIQDETASSALNWARAGGFGNELRDVSAAELKEYAGIDHTLYNAADVGTKALMVATKLTPTGIAAGVAHPLNWLLLLNSGGKTTPAQHVNIMAWMPKEMAPDWKMARYNMDTIAKEVVLSEYAEGTSLRLIWEGVPPVKHRVLRAVGPGCELECGETKETACDTPAPGCKVSAVAAIPVEGFAPDMLGGYPAWVWAARGDHAAEIGMYAGQSTKPNAAETLDVYKRLSAKLPPWVAIYLPARNMVTDKKDADQYGPLPVVIHKGEVQLFVTPEGAAAGAPQETKREE